MALRAVQHFDLDRPSHAFSVASVRMRRGDDRLVVCAGDSCVSLRSGSGGAALVPLDVPGAARGCDLSGVCGYEVAAGEVEIAVAVSRIKGGQVESRSLRTLALERGTAPERALSLRYEPLGGLHTCQRDPRAPCHAYVLCGSDGRVHTYHAHHGPDRAELLRFSALRPGTIPEREVLWARALRACLATPGGDAPMQAQLRFIKGAGERVWAVSATQGGAVQDVWWAPPAAQPPAPESTSAGPLPPSLQRGPEAVLAAPLFGAGPASCAADYDAAMEHLSRVCGGEAFLRWARVDGPATACRVAGPHGVAAVCAVSATAASYQYVDAGATMGATGSGAEAGRRCSGLKGCMELAGATRHDAATCCAAADLDEDGVEELYVGTYGQRVLAYAWGTDDAEGLVPAEEAVAPSPVMGLAAGQFVERPSLAVHGLRSLQILEWGPLQVGVEAGDDGWTGSG